jgi:hypothetical protein
MTLHTGVFSSCSWSVLTGRIQDEDVAGFVRHIHGIRAKNADALVIDIAHSVSLPNPMQRKQIVDAVGSIEDKQLILGHAVVTNTAVARGVLQVVNWFVTPVFPEKVFRSPREAAAWLATRAPRFDHDGLLRELERCVPGFERLRW